MNRSNTDKGASGSSEHGAVGTGRYVGVLSESPIVSEENWTDLSAAGWRWSMNVPPFLGGGQRVADGALARMIDRHGREHVTTGNAWRHGAPKGRANEVGIYVRDMGSSAGVLAAAAPSQARSAPNQSNLEEGPSAA